MAAKKKPTVETIAKILNGDLDGDLGEIHAAVINRVLQSGTVLHWRITLEGDPPFVVTEDDLTLDEACDVETIAGVTWHQIDPAASARLIRHILTVALRSRAGLDAEGITQRLSGLTAMQAVNAVDRYEAPLAPLGDRKSVV